jgi:hypothetical protein
MIRFPRKLLILPAALLLTGAAAGSDLSYAVSLSDADPMVAEFELRGPAAGLVLVPARGGAADAIEVPRCGNQPVPLRDGRLTVPPGCRALRWRVRLVDQDRGVDASVPPSSWSAAHRFWFLAERHGWLRPPGGPAAGTVTVRVRRAGGQVSERRIAFPTGDEPPFYAVIGFDPARAYRRDGFRLSIFGRAPQFPWMDRTHDAVLGIWARWRRDLIPAGVNAPSEMMLAWLPPVPGQEPGYSASAGAAAIGAQIVLREGDPDSEAKARAVILTSAAHEGFHSITGAGAQAWPAWANESLANHFAIQAARVSLAPTDFAWISRFYIEPRMPGGLLAAQAAYAAGDGEQRYQFYTKGARFWAEIERVLTVTPNGSGRLAALIRSSRNFRDVDLANAPALAAFLDRHSQGRAGAIVDCFLVRLDCDAPARP